MNNTKNQKITLFFYQVLGFFLFISTSSIAQEAEELISKRVEEKKAKGLALNYQDFEHINLGCPENSLCDKNMGEKLISYSKLIEKLKQNKNHSENIKPLNQFLQSNGLPVTFLSSEKARDRFWPILEKSNCSYHEKDKENLILKGTSFIKKTDKDFAYVSYQNSIQQIPHGELILMDELKIEGENLKFKLPYNTRPSYMKKNKMIFLVNSEDFYYAISVDSSGKWQVVDHDKDLKSFYRDRQEVPCKETIAMNAKFYQGRFCQKIFDVDSKKYKVVNIPWSCN